MKATTRKSLAFVCFAGALALAACSAKKVPTRQHEGPIPDSPVVYAPVLGADKAEFMAMKLDKPESDSLKSLESFVLNASYIENPDYRDTTRMRAMLTKYNRALLGVLRTKGMAGVDAETLKNYRDSVLSGCDEDLVGCRNILFFKTDPVSSEIFKYFVKKTDTELAKLPDGSDERLKKTRDYYRDLTVARDLKNGMRDREIEFLYLNRAADYSKYFEKHSAAASTRPLLQRHAQIFETVLNDYEPNLADPATAKQFEAFVNNFKPWSYSRKTPNPFGFGATKMLELAASNYLYQGGKDKGGGTLSPSLKAALEESQKIAKKPDGSPLCIEEESTEPDVAADPKKTSKEQKASVDPSAETEKSHSAVIKCLTTNNASLVSGLKLNTGVQKDEYFFIIDRLFRGHLNIDDATRIWRGSHRNEARLLEATENYLRVELANMIVKTNAHMSKVYAKKDEKDKKATDKDTTSKTLFTNAIDESLVISTQWHHLLSKADILGTFVNAIMKRSDVSLQSQNFNRFEKMFNSIRRNIKYISVYPNMMLMTYFMVEVKYEFEVQTFFGVVTIPVARIIEWFFQGEAAPFFNFHGNDPNPISRMETLYAFYFALKTDTFRAFNVNKDTPVDEQSFFDVVIGKYLDDEKRDLEHTTNKLSDTFTQSQTYGNFRLFCKRDMEAAKTHQGDGPVLGRYQLSIPLEELAHYTYMGSTEMGWGKEAYDFYNTELASKIQGLRNDLNNKLTFVQTLVDIYDYHLASTGVPQEKRLELKAKVGANLDKIKVMKREFLTEIVRRHGEISECLYNTSQIEEDRQFRLYSREEQFLRKVFHIIKDLQGKTDGELAAAESAANEKLRSLVTLLDPKLPQDAAMAIPPGFSGFSRVSSREYVMSEIDLILRMRRYMREVAPNVLVVLPPRLEDSQTFRNARLATVAFPTDAKLDTPEAVKAAEDQFVADAMRNFNGTENAFLKWAASTTSVDHHLNKLKVLTQLYLLGKIEIFDIASPECKDKTLSRTCPNKTGTQSAAGLVNEIFRVAKALDLGEVRPDGSLPPKRQILKWLDLRMKWQKIDQFKLMFLDVDTHEPLTLTENVFEWITADTARLEMARSYFNGQRNVGHFLFTPEADVKNLLKNNHLALAVDSFNAALEFEKAVYAREEQDEKNQFSIVYESAPEKRIVPPRSGGRPIYLKRKKIEDFKATMNLFHKETCQHFNPEKTDKEKTEGCEAK